MPIDTVIFLTNRFFKLYNFEQLKKYRPLKFIAILATTSKSEITLEISKHFEQIIYIDQSEKWPYALSYTQTEAAIKNIIVDHKPTIICNDDVNMINSGKLREVFGLSGMNASQCLKYSNKITMKNILTQKKIAVPTFESINSSRYLAKERGYYEELKAKLGLPFVLKPFNAASSRGLKIVYSLADFFSVSDGDIVENYEVESFIDGDLYHCDTVIQNKKILFQGVAKYSRPMGEFLKGYPIATEIMSRKDYITEEIKTFTASVLESLGKLNGVGHTEIFCDKNNKLWFLETAARAPGGFTIPAYEKAYGINLLTLDYRIQVSELVTMEYSDKYFVGCCLFPLFKGIVVNRKVPPIHSKHQMLWHVKIGDRIEASMSLSDTSAMMLLWNDSAEMLKKDLDMISCFKCIEVS